MLLHTYNHRVWNKKKKKKKTNQCVSESGWVSEWVNEVNGSDSHCVADSDLCEWACEVASDGQIDRQIDR